MNGQTPQPPQNNWWEATLAMFAWACRIPLAFFLVFACGCVGFLAFMFFIRVTVWIYQHGLAHSW